MSDAGFPRPASRAAAAPWKGMVLFILGISQLMIVLDATIVNVALSHIMVALEVRSYADLQWIVTGYTLAFGGFLLLGGKLADRLGRRRVFVAGATLFAFASLLGGFAQSLGLLIAARALQGTGAAMMAPAALSLLTVVFSEGKERNRAFGVWASISAGGAAIGLMLGGVLTTYASWRWVLFVNVPIAIFAIAGALRFVPESRDEKARGFDVPGSILVTGGLMALVYALGKGNEFGWGSQRTILTLAGAAVLLAAFVVVQLRSASPLLPFRLFRSRSLLGADLGGLLVAGGMFSIFFFMVLWMQQINGWSPIRAGFAFLPVTVGITIGAAISSMLLGRIGARPLVTVGPVIAGSGLILIGSFLTPTSSYVGLILPGLILLALGMGITFVAVTTAAVSGVPKENAGIASALLNASQQVGGSIGLALITAVSTGHTNALAPGGRPTNPAEFPAYMGPLVAGWALGLVVGGCLLWLAALVMTSLIRTKSSQGIPAGAMV